MGAHSKPLLGLAYILMIGLLVMASILIFRKDLPWQTGALVTIRTDTPGLELNPRSDVKLQGLRVGEVRRITSDGGSAVIEIAIDDDKLGLIPANVDAAIIPKTLFGEKFVDLKIPEQASTELLASGDVIKQSTTSVEIGEIFSKLVPVLRTLKPEQLSVTLTSLEETLDGRGATVARDLNQLKQLFDEVEPHLDNLTRDVEQFATTADIYAAAAPDLMRLLESSSSISAELLVPKEKSFESFLEQTLETSDDTTKVLRRNRDDLDTLAARSRPVLSLLDDYSSALPCFLKGLHTLDILGNQSIGARGPFVNLIADVIGVQKPYANPEDLPDNPNSDGSNRNLPEAVPRSGPHCPEFPQRVLDLEDAEPYSMLLPGVVLDPENDTSARSSSTTPAPSAVPEAAPQKTEAELAKLLGDLLVDPLVPGGATR